MEEDREIQELRERALSAIMKLPEQRQIILWTILHRFSKENKAN